MKLLEIKARDGMTISGNLFGESDKLIILMHGLTDATTTSYLNRQAVNLFLEKGYSVYNFDFYSDEELNFEKPRALYGSVTLKRHSEDAQDVFNFFKSSNQYKQIFVIGHSFGGLTTNRANINCTAQALWDPIFHGDYWSENASIAYVGDIPTMNWGGRKIIINNNMIEDAKTITKKVAGKWASELTAPTYFALIKESLNYNKFYQIYLHSHSKYEELEGSHNFNQPNKLEEVVNKTDEFFKRF